MRTQFPVVLMLSLFALMCGCDTGKNAGETPQPKAPETVLERIRKAGVIRIAIRSESEPFSFKDAEGNPRGFEVDLGFRLAKELNVRPDFIFVEPKDRIEVLKSGQVDCVLATLTATRRRYKEVDFSVPYFEDQQRLLVKADSPVQSYRDLAGRTVAAIQASTNFENMTTVQPDCKTVGVKDLAEGFELLRSGKVDALTGDGIKLFELASKNKDLVRVAGEGFSVEPYCVGLPRNDSEFRRTVDDFLMNYWSKGEWTKGYNKWLSGSPDQKVTFQMPILPD
jgi:polar amino acid transport system substrate-binding protein